MFYNAKTLFTRPETRNVVFIKYLVICFHWVPSFSCINYHLIRITNILQRRIHARINIIYSLRLAQKPHKLPKMFYYFQPFVTNLTILVIFILNKSIILMSKFLFVIKFK